jgi:hypothetical protein
VVVLVVVDQLRIIWDNLEDPVVEMLTLTQPEMQHQLGQAIRSLDLVQQYHHQMVGVITVE